MLFCAALIAFFGAGADSRSDETPCHDTACARLHDDWFKARYDAAQTLYLTPDNAHTLLDTIDSPAQRVAARQVITQLAPASVKAPAHPISCAVVGNSGNLTGSGYGKLIDQHAYVFRMNNAPIEAYTADVGRRTTHHVLHTMQKTVRHYSDETLTIFAYDAWGVNYAHLTPQDAYKQTVARQAQWLSGALGDAHFPPQGLANTYLLHPQFLSYINQRWFTPPHYRRSDYPSIGFKTIILALHLCDSVDLFGFGANTARHSWDHYFNAGTPLNKHFPKLHRTDYQQQFLDRLQQSGAVRVYPGNIAEHRPL